MARLKLIFAVLSLAVAVQALATESIVRASRLTVRCTEYLKLDPMEITLDGNTIYSAAQTGEDGQRLSWTGRNLMTLMETCRRQTTELAKGGFMAIGDQGLFTVATPDQAQGWAAQMSELELEVRAAQDLVRKAQEETGVVQRKLEALCSERISARARRFYCSEEAPSSSNQIRPLNG
jgi:hypothetical protein